MFSDACFELATKMTQVIKNANQLDENGYPLLLKMAAQGDANAVENLILMGADVNVRSSRGENIMHVATKSVLQKFYNESSPGFQYYSECYCRLLMSPNNMGLLPYEDALFGEKFCGDRLYYLLYEDVRSRTSTIREQIRRLVKEGNSDRLALLKEVPEIFQLVRDEFFTAIQVSDMDAIDTFLKGNIGVNVKKAGNITPIIVATYRNDKNIIERLFECEDLDSSIATKNGMTALLISIEGDFDGAFHALTKGILYKTNRDRRIELLNWVSPKTGDTALTTAFRRGRYDMADVLINYGANTSCKDLTGRTLLHRMVLKGDVDGVDLLSQYSSYTPMDTKDKFGFRPLCEAVIMNNLPIIKILARCNHVDVVMHYCKQGYSSKCEHITISGFATPEARNIIIVEAAIKYIREEYYDILGRECPKFGLDYSFGRENRSQLLSNFSDTVRHIMLSRDATKVFDLEQLEIMCEYWFKATLGEFILRDSFVNETDNEE